MTEEVKVSAKELITRGFDFETQTFKDIFIQMFVEINGGFNYRYFNEFHEVSLTHGDINAAIKELTGSKKIEYRDPDESTQDMLDTFRLFKKVYEFGGYPNARSWIWFIHDQTQVTLSRSLVLGWIAEQRPERSLKSFAPVNDGNLYHANEKPVHSPAAKPESGSGE